MLSSNTRIKLESICTRIENHEEVSFEEMIWATKWAGANRVASRMLSQARRVASSGRPEDGSLDELLNDLDLGDPDPQRHLTSESTPDDIYNFFKRDDLDDWRTRD